MLDNKEMTNVVTSIPLAEICLKVNSRTKTESVENCSIEVFDWVDLFENREFSVHWVKQQTIAIVMEASRMLLDIAKITKRRCSGSNKGDIELKIMYQLENNNKCNMVFDKEAFVNSAADVSVVDTKIVEAMCELLIESTKHTLVDFDAFISFITGTTDGVKEYYAYAAEIFETPMFDHNLRGDLN